MGGGPAAETRAASSSRAGVGVDREGDRGDEQAVHKMMWDIAVLCFVSFLAGLFFDYAVLRSDMILMV